MGTNPFLFLIGHSSRALCYRSPWITILHISRLLYFLNNYPVSFGLNCILKSFCFLLFRLQPCENGKLPTVTKGVALGLSATHSEMGLALGLRITPPRWKVHKGCRQAPLKWRLNEGCEQPPLKLGLHRS